VSVAGDQLAASDAYGLRGALKSGKGAVIMLTSAHQAMVNTPANMELAARTITDELGAIDAVFFPGDLVNIPDRASEWSSQPGPWRSRLRCSRSTRVRVGVYAVKRTSTSLALASSSSSCQVGSMSQLNTTRTGGS
jgi:hypothetical protein